MRGYPDRLRQAFLNVAVNALEAMPQGGRLTWRRAGRDAGPSGPLRHGTGHPRGGPPAALRADFSTKDGGSGIGLHVARALVEMHGGEIRIESDVGEGHRVRVVLPLRLRRPDSMPRALIVDDDLGFLAGLAELVKREGFAVRERRDALKQAREEIAADRPTSCSSTSTCRTAAGSTSWRARGRAAPEVVLITGSASVETAVDALRRGVADYLTKPVDFARVKMALGNVTRALEMRGEIGRCAASCASWAASGR